MLYDVVEPAHLVAYRASHPRATRVPEVPLPKHTILFLAANPLGADRRALDREARAIQSELERSGHRDHFEFVTRWAAEPLDLLRELRKLKPTIIHFSGHGSRATPSVRSEADLHGDVVAGSGSGELQSGLFFQGPDGRPKLVSTLAFQETLGAAGSSVKVVVLSACCSEAQAEALLVHVDCVIGMAGSIRDDAARTFAVGFYGGLAERESVAAAYRQGRAAIGLEGLSGSEEPQLMARAGSDAERFVLCVDGPAALAPAAMQAESLGDGPKVVESPTLNERGYEQVRFTPANRFRALWIGVSIAIFGSILTWIVSWTRTAPLHSSSETSPKGTALVQTAEEPAAESIESGGGAAGRRPRAPIEESASSDAVNAAINTPQMEASLPNSLAQTGSNGGTRSPGLRSPRPSNNMASHDIIVDVTGPESGTSNGSSEKRNNIADYSYSRSRNKLLISPRSLLLEEMGKGMIPTIGLHNECGIPIGVQFPVLAIKLVNNSPETVVLSEISLKVRTSDRDLAPLLAIDSSKANGDIEIYNEGWSDILEPNITLHIENSKSLSYSLSKIKEGLSIDLRPRHVREVLSAIRPSRRFLPVVSLSEFAGGDPIEIAEYPLQVRGDLSLKTENGRSHHYRFATIVQRSLSGVACSPLLPTFKYNVFLTAGKTGYTESCAISQVIKPGEADHFLLRIASDRSARFELTMNIRDVKKRSLWHGDVDMKLFVPRYSAGHTIQIPVVSENNVEEHK
jgi:hypothetical protein